MKLVLFYHSLVSDWNHGNAHFLRGVVRELLELGHAVEVYEPASGWSLAHLIEAQGQGAIAAFRAAYPELRSRFYTEDELDLERALDGADVAIVHEWNTPALVARIGAAAARLGVRAYFHDTHHRSVTAPDSMAALDLSGFEGVLAFGAAIAERYRANGWAKRVWVWHEAADVRRFQPLCREREGDLVWVGNWGDDERTHELQEFVIDPVADLALRARIFGVRYPAHAQQALARAGIAYGGWLANHDVPEVFARYACTVHVPRRAYRDSLPGIPTIRMFEALACGIPLICAPWDDAERLFRPGLDYLVVSDGREMREHLRAVLHSRELRESLAQHGLETIRARHTCAHRARELLSIIGDQRSRAQPTCIQRAGAST
jgi:spore maturation protein CgeB